MQAIRYIFLCLLLSPLGLRAGDGEKELPSQINTITVFIHGAQIMRTASTTVPKGTSVWKFTGLSPDLNPQSITVNPGAEVTLLSVQHKMNYMKQQERDENVKQLRALLDRYQQDLQHDNKLLEVITDKRALLNNNKNIRGEETGLDLISLKATIAYYREQLTALNNRENTIRADMDSTNVQINKLNNQLNELNAASELSTSEIWVTINSEKAVRTDFTLNYLVHKASWTPFYDIRVQDISKPLSMTYKARVNQLSGEDWNNVNLVLSTGDPSDNGTRPTMVPWRLDFYQPLVLEDKEKEYDFKTTPKREAAKAYYHVADSAILGGTFDPLGVTAHANTTSTEFRIPITYTIPSDGKDRTVEINQFDMPAEYQYYSAPKLDPSAFLTARIANWESYNLLSGETNLYFEGTFLGKSYLDMAQIKDTMTIGLGKDKDIAVTRTRMKEYTKKQFLGSMKTESRGFEIAVRNKKKQAIHIIVCDQIPLSADQQIKVELLKTDAKLDEPTGKLVWKLTIPAANDQKMSFGYTVKYPKGKDLPLE